jgi:hypothetical protein
MEGPTVLQGPVSVWRTPAGGRIDTFQLPIRGQPQGLVPSLSKVGQMTTFDVRGRCTFQHPVTREQLERSADALMEALLDLGVADPAVSVTFSACVIEVELIGVHGPTAADALKKGSEIVAAAVQKTGGTVGLLSGVPSEADPEEWTVRRQPADLLTSA